MIQTRQESRQGLLLLIVPAGAHILRKLLPGSVIGADFPQGTFGADLFLLGIIVVFIDVFAVDAVDFISGYEERALFTSRTPEPQGPGLLRR